MSANDIIFNAPALNSLKRAQLVQLCKSHDLKTTGKNNELVNRLQEYAQVMSTDGLLTVFEGSENRPSTDDSHENGVDTQRSNQSLDYITELTEESSRNGSANSKKSVASSGSAGEFGTSTSKSSLFSSIASSIGLKRSGSANSNHSSQSSQDSKKDKGGGSPKSSKSTFSLLMGRTRSTSQTSVRDSLTTKAVPYESIPASRPSQLPHTDPFTFSNPDETDPELEDVSMASIDRPVPGLGPSNSVPAELASAGSTVRLITSVTSSSDLGKPPNLPAIMPSFDLVPPTPGKPGVACWPNSPSPTRKLYHKFNIEENDGQDAEDHDGGFASPMSPKEPFIFGSPNPRHSTAANDFSSAALSVLAEMNSRLGAAGSKAIGADVLKTISSATTAPASVDELLKYEFGTKDKVDGTAATVEGSIKAKFDRAHEKEFDKMIGIDEHYAAKRAETTATEPLNIGKKRKSTVLGSRTGPPAKKQQSSNVRATTTATRRKAAIPGAFDDDDDEDDEDSTNEEAIRGAKRACVGDIGSRKVSVAPGAMKQKEDAEEKKKQSDAIKRQLALNKQRRKSTRARPSLGVPQNPKPRFGFLANAAKSIVKTVWGRGGPAPASTSRKSVAPMRKTSEMRKSSVTGPSKATTTAAPAEPTGGQPSNATAVSPTSDVPPPIPEKPGSNMKPKADVPALAPRTRKPSNAPTVASATSKTTIPRTSRLTAPTASSLAKMNAVKASGTTSSLSKPATANAKAKPASRLSKIPVMSPSKKLPGTSANGGKIFSKPLSPPSSPQARAAEQKGLKINPITGLTSPSRRPFSSANATQGPSLMGIAASIASEKENKDDTQKLKKPELSILKKPRISRSRIQERVGDTTVQRSRSPGPSPSKAGTSAPADRKRVSSPRKSAGGAKARGNTLAGAGGVLMSAKKRARATEYSKRKSTRASTVATAAGNGTQGGAEVEG